MTRHYIPSIFFLLALTMCNAQISFSESAEDLGVDYASGTSPWGNGVTFYDYNQDGWDDITLTSATGVRLRFFKNNNGVFEEEILFDPAINYRTKQANWVDFDNDGDKDLFVTSDTDGNRLYENTGNLNLVDITIAAGLPTTNMYTYGASWGDYNNDGYLDVYVSNRDEVTFTIPNFLYKNNGNGTFTDVSTLVGLNTTAHSSFCSAFFDFNNDGLQDIFVANDRSIYKNFMYKNNGDGTFTDVGDSSGAGIFMNAMSATIGDFNHDGWFDIYITNTFPGNVFLINNGDETFTDIAEATSTTFNAVAWGAVFFDAENDMDLDLYVSGMVNNNPALIPYAFYENNNDGTFSEPMAIGFETDDRSSFSNAIGDFNNDGLFDVVVSNNDEGDLFLWENNTATTNNWLKVKLEGVISNKDGVGSVIEISVNGNKQYRYTLCGEGYLSQNSQAEVFGLGSNSLVDYVKVTWLSGIVDTYTNVSANQTLDIVEDSETLSTVNITSNQTINVYPNPVSNILTISTISKPDRIKLFNNIGQQLYVISNTSLVTKLDMFNLDSGIYYLKVLMDNKIEVLRIIKS